MSLYSIYGIQISKVQILVRLKKGGIIEIASHLAMLLSTPLIVKFRLYDMTTTTVPFDATLW